MYLPTIEFQYTTNSSFFTLFYNNIYYSNIILLNKFIKFGHFNFFSHAKRFCLYYYFYNSNIIQYFIPLNSYVNKISLYKLKYLFQTVNNSLKIVYAFI